MDLINVLSVVAITNWSKKLIQKIIHLCHSLTLPTRPPFLLLLFTSTQALGFVLVNFGKYCFSFFLRIGLMCVCLQLSPLLLLTTIKRSISIVNIKNNDIFFNDIGVYLYQIIVFSLCIISSHLTDGSCLGLLARLQLVACLLDKAKMEQDAYFQNNLSAQWDYGDCETRLVRHGIL